MTTNRGSVDTGASFAIDTTAISSGIGTTATLLITSATLDTHTNIGTLQASYTSPATSTSIALGTVAALPAMAFASVVFPSGTYISSSSPVRLGVLTVTVELQADSGHGDTLACPYVLSWDLNTTGSGVVTPSFLGGSGTLVFTGVPTVRASS